MMVEWWLIFNFKGLLPEKIIFNSKFLQREELNEKL